MGPGDKTRNHCKLLAMNLKNTCAFFYFSTYLKHCCDFLTEIFEKGVVQGLGDRGHLITEYDGALSRGFTALENILKH